jgi:hypothetical protein
VQVWFGLSHVFQNQQLLICSYVITPQINMWYYSYLSTYNSKVIVFIRGPHSFTPWYEGTEAKFSVQYIFWKFSLNLWRPILQCSSFLGLHEFCKRRLCFTQYCIIYQQRYLGYTYTAALYFFTGFAKLLNIIRRYSLFAFSITERHILSQFRFSQLYLWRLKFSGFFILPLLQRKQGTRLKCDTEKMLFVCNLW